MLGRRQGRLDAQPEDALEWIDPDELADPVGDELVRLNAAYARALRTSDVEGLVALFEPDGGIVDMDGPDYLRHDGLREMTAFARERYADVSFEIDVTWTKVDGLDPAVAYAAGSWRMGFVARSGSGGGERVHLRGTFVQTWHRGAGDTWRLYRDVTLSREADA